MRSAYPSTALRTRFREIKDLTKDQLAIITEGSEGSYVFGSEQAFEDEIAAEARAGRTICRMTRTG